MLPVRTHHFLSVPNDNDIVVQCIAHRCIFQNFTGVRRHQSSRMTNNKTSITIASSVVIFSVTFQFITTIIGALGNVTVIICTILLCKEKTATSYLIANLALTHFLVCLTFYPLWIIEFIQTI